MLKYKLDPRWYILELADKDLKAVIFKENMVTMFEQKRNPGIEMKIRKKNQMENLELKRMISKMKIKVHCIGLIDFRE